MVMGVSIIMKAVVECKMGDGSELSEASDTSCFLETNAILGIGVYKVQVSDRTA